MWVLVVWEKDDEMYVLGDPDFEAISPFIMRKKVEDYAKEYRKLDPISSVRVHPIESLAPEDFED